MRSKNIEVTFKIPIPIDKPDANGCIYSKEAIEKSIDSYKNCPIEICNDNTYDTKVVGVIKNARMEADYVVTKGIIFAGGTSESVAKFANGIVLDMTIQSVGIDID